MSILILCPSRERPGALRRMISSVRQTAKKVDIALYFDEDDPTRSRDYPGCSVTIGKPLQPARAVNELIRLHPGYDVYGAATDDCQFVTPGWDSWVEEQRDKFPRKIGTISPFHNSRRMDFPWATREWIDVVGWLAYPKIEHFYWDIIVEMLGEQSGLVYAEPEEFMIEHSYHDHAGQADRISRDAKAFALWCCHERREMISRLQNAIGDAYAEAPARS